MSWKMFGQIVLLIVIAAVILSAIKCGAMNCKFGRHKSGMRGGMEQMQKGMMQK